MTLLEPQPDPRAACAVNNVGRRRAAGFTLVELLTSVAIISIIMVIIFPVVGAMKNGSRIEAGLNTVSLASDVARAWSTASLPQADLGSDPVAPVFGATYSGTAALFCPTGEVRIVINHQRADDGASFLESLNPPLNGYRDYRTKNGGRRDLDYISIPQGSGVVGVRRFGSNAGDVQLLAPPFAIAYDETGTLVQGFIYYDSNFIGGYDTGSNRFNVPGGYDPADWSHDAVAVDPTELVRPLPFEEIETVVGVIIYSEADYAAAGFALVGGFVQDGNLAALEPETDAYDWLRENGTTVFFSPNTGVAMRDEGKE